MSNYNMLLSAGLGCVLGVLRYYNDRGISTAKT